MDVYPCFIGIVCVLRHIDFRFGVAKRQCLNFILYNLSLFAILVIQEIDSHWQGFVSHCQSLKVDKIHLRLTDRQLRIYFDSNTQKD